MSGLLHVTLRSAALAALTCCVGCSTHVTTGPVATVPVYYATTRKVVLNATLEKAFGTAGKNAAEREGNTLEKDPTGQFYRLLPTPRA
jgi:hypothetical protein